MKLVALLAAAASCLGLSQGLRCFTCDSEASDGLCTNSPGTIPYGTAECPGGVDDDYYCYTTRLEEQMEDIIKITVNRNCCKAEEGSEYCPPTNSTTGVDFIEVDRTASEGYSFSSLRCQEDLCNDDVDDEDTVDYDDGALIVEGNRPDDYEYPSEDDNDDGDEDDDDDDDDNDDDDESGVGGVQRLSTALILTILSLAFLM